MMQYGSGNLAGHNLVFQLPVAHLSREWRENVAYAWQRTVNLATTCELPAAASGDAHAGAPE
jgi:hypothetical protein